MGKRRLSKKRKKRIGGRMVLGGGGMGIIFSFAGGIDLLGMASTMANWVGWLIVSAIISLIIWGGAMYIINDV